MTKTKLWSLSAAFVLAFAGMDASAADVSFSYTYGDQNYEQGGTKKAETYDVAIRLIDPTIVGSKLKTFSVPIALGQDASDLSEISVWVSKELNLDGKVNAPDLFSMDAEIVDGVINATFTEEIEIPEDGLYVGYTFKVDKRGDVGDYPIYLAGAPVEEGLYLHSSRTYLKWKSQADTFQHSSAITVGLEGDFYATALGITQLDDPTASPGEELMLTATLQNHGYEPIANFEYTITDGVTTQTNTISLDGSKALYFNESFNAELPYVAPEAKEEYSLKVEITKVNGVENLDALKSRQTYLLVLTEFPVHKPLMEEYTGLWCGYCPRGYVALEVMNLRHPDEFVAISYHNGDDMERTSNFPSEVKGFPTAYMDRVYQVDAYYGQATLISEGFAIEPFWQSLQEQFTPAIVNGSALQAEDGTITVKSDISFVKTVSGSYKVAYAIVANGLTEEDWAQSNYYGGSNPSQYVPEMEKFCTGGGKIFGLVFDDVYAAGSNLKGEPKSLIENVVKDQVYTYEYSFAANAGVSTRGYNMFENAPELYAVIILLDETGAVVNSNKILVEGHSGVESVMADGNTVSTEFFDLNGRRVNDPSNGMFLKVDTKENGKKVTSKVILK